MNTSNVKKATPTKTDFISKQFPKITINVIPVDEV